MKIVIVGGGIVGVFAALYARQLSSTAQIVLIDHDIRLGGLLRSEMHPNGLQFDSGTHILSWTGVPAIDSILFDELPAKNWHIFEGPCRDLSGLFVGNEVREASPFLSAQSSGIPSEQLMRVARQSGLSLPNSLMSYLTERFGLVVSNDVFRNAIRNLYGEELESLDTFVANQLPLSRIVVDELDIWLKNATDADYRSIIACPEQRALPSTFTNKLRAAYPRRMGIEQLFEAIGPKLNAAGIEIALETRVTRIAVVDSCVTEVTLEARDGRSNTIKNDVAVVWAAAPFPLVKLLGVATTLPPLKQAWRTVIIDFTARLRQKLSCYYYIDYGSNEFFRLTNYSALCEQAQNMEHAPFTYELWYRGDELTEREAHEIVSRRFIELELIHDKQGIDAVRVRSLAQGAVPATITNIAALHGLTSAVAAKLPSNMLNVGLLSTQNLFFTADLLKNAELQLRVRHADGFFE
jgi:protoporphyrinogen oxidase